MLGNRLGWVITAALAALLTWTAWELRELNRRTTPTALLDTAAKQRLQFDVPPEQIFRFDSPGDGGLLYRAALRDVRDNAARYVAIEQSTVADLFEKTPAGGGLLAAAPKAAGPILSANPQACGGYEALNDDLDAATLAAQLLGRAALLHRPHDRARAQQLFEAEFSFGAKLFAERARYAEAVAGLAIVREAVAGLQTTLEAGDDARRGALLATFDRSAAGLQETQLTPVWNAVGSFDTNVIAGHAGDIYAIAGPATQEKMWRIEAILALGRHSFAAAREADRLAVPGRLAMLAKDETDPIVLAAIHAAQALTVEQYRMLR